MLTAGIFRRSKPCEAAEIPAFAANGTEPNHSLEEIAAMLKVLSKPSATAVATAAWEN
jgi:hypothetical protein